MSPSKTTLFLLALAACDGKGDDSTGDPGNKLPEGCDVDICAKYVATMPLAIKQIVEQASTDPTFEDDFAPLVAKGKKAVGAFEQSLANYLGNLYGCAGAPEYDGPSMEDAHAGMNISQQEYDDFVALIASVLVDNGVPTDTINSCFAPPLQDASLASQIVGQ
jgi:hypothetical protein